MLSHPRDLFSLPADLRFLNCASKAPLLKRAEAVGIDGIRRQVAPTPVAPEDYFTQSETLRSALGALINASPDRIALTPSVSYGLSIATQNVRLHAGQNVVTVEEEFPSNAYAWIERCAKDGAELRAVPRQATGAQWNARLLEAIDTSTGAICLSSVHWTDGLRFDLEAIGARAREVDALFVVDGTQSVGAAAFDFERVRPDLLVCAGYKWLLGPYQIGFAAVGDRLIDAEPFEYHWSNRAGCNDVTQTGYHREYQRGARRFDVGEHENDITAPMLTEGVRQAREWGADAIQSHCTRLGERIESALDADRFAVAPAAERVAHIIGIRPRDATRLEPIMASLAARNVRVSKRGSAVRVSPHVYNSSDDIDALLAAITEGAA